MKFIIGKKIEMTQRFSDDGQAIPVTAIQAGPCTVTQVKTEEKEGYNAVQVGFGGKKKLTKPLAGHLKGLSNFRYIFEFREDKPDGLKRGDIITVSSFIAGDKVKVVGTSKGRGFQGVVKRHKFAGGKGSHGDKDQLRMPGSIGATDAARVFKGMRMAGHMGNERVTIDNQKIQEVDSENNLIFIKGAVPGPRNSIVLISAPGEIKIEGKDDKKSKQEAKTEGQKKVEKEKAKPQKEDKKQPTSK
ncbi:50S ribosomal protein L3 [Patescibacteria group bacterium]|nr:50S ribosomal protein L3 [Patescibacteria group bacterium]MBU0963784.1 50S ribosomal protein L3 [Patescibacteria group bacterium]